MKILVAVKQVASLDEDFEIRADGKDVDPDFLVRDLNEWDDYRSEEHTSDSSHRIASRMPSSA